MALVKALEHGDFIEIAFQTSSGQVHGMAEMLNPARQYSNGCLQPFRFIAIGDEDHRKLRMAVESVMDRNFLGGRVNQPSAPKGL